jgi:hypothetical protein
MCTIHAYAQMPSSGSSEEFPTLRITELVAKGSVITNEFGMKSDWLKIENYGTESIHLSDHKIFISDNENRLRKFRLKKLEIAPQSSIIIWCDDLAVTKNQIHTNFKLSSEGETISLSISNGKDTEIIDQVYYLELGKNVQKTLLRSDSKMLVHNQGD